MGFGLVSRGHAKNCFHYNREPGVFVIAVEKVFSFRVDWHQLDRVQPLVAQYQLALDAVLQAHPELRPCATHCAHCGIRFLTHPRNAGRRNLRCPFGCRRHHRRQRCCQRSTAYYQTAAGKRKKQALNRRRRSAEVPPSPGENGLPASPNQTLSVEVSPPDSPSSETLPTETPAELRLDGVLLDESSLSKSPVLPYLRMLLSLIDGVRLGTEELLGLLRQALRQHSIASRKRVDYVLHVLPKHPP